MTEFEEKAKEVLLGVVKTWGVSVNVSKEYDVREALTALTRLKDAELRRELELLNDAIADPFSNRAALAALIAQRRAELTPQEGGE